MRRAGILRLTVALQAVLFAAPARTIAPGPTPSRSAGCRWRTSCAGPASGPARTPWTSTRPLASKGLSIAWWTTRPSKTTWRRIKLFNLDLKKLGDLQRWWLLRMVYTRRPLQEKMVLFWHGL